MTQIPGKTYKADATTQLGMIVDPGSVQCVVTSTAYWGKRNYAADYDAKPSDAEMGRSSLQAFIDEQVLLGRQVWSALADTGTYWLNLGDTSSGSGGAGGDHGAKGSKGAHTGAGGIAKYKQGKSGLAPGQQCLVPERVAIALQEPYYEGLVRNEVDRAWLAGMVDADGCIAAGHLPPRKENHNDSYNVFVAVGSVDRMVLEHIQQLVGGRGTITNKGPSGNLGKRDFFEWRMNKDVDRLLEDLYPHLVGKRLQAQVAWTLKSLAPGRRSGLYARVSDPQIQKRRHQLYEALKDLHAGRAVDIKWLKEVSIPQLQPGWFVKKVLTWDKGAPYELEIAGETHRFARGGIKPEDPRHVRRPRFASETILMLVKDVKRYTYNHEAEVEPGDVWHFPPHRGRRRTGPAPFPEELPRRCILLSTNPGDLVLDPCMGSGTTGRVAEDLGRQWIGVDLYKGVRPRRSAQ